MKMKVKFQDVEEAYDFVSFGPYGDHSALLDKSTGKIHWHSESGDLDEIPEKMWESEDMIEIPHKKDLGLGNHLVFEFIKSQAPDDYPDVREIFSKRGAYARYKSFLESKGILQEWYDFEQKAQQQALREWCEENEIELTG
jgi:hypothetical protein